MHYWEEDLQMSENKRVFILLWTEMAKHSEVPTEFKKEVLSQIRAVLQGNKVSKNVFVSDIGHNFVGEVQKIMYLTDISIDDMLEVLWDLRNRL